jgi:CheY-like chemotaxis protein
MTDKKILVIDDDPDILDSVKTILKANGFSTLTAQGGQEGIDIFNREKPDLVFCDMMMESVDEGYKVASRIRESNANVPVFLLSSIGNATSMTLDPASMGFTGVFQKPVNPAALISTVKSALNIK